MTRRARMIVGGVPLLLVAVYLFRPDALGEGNLVNLYMAATVAGGLAVAIGVWRWRPQPLWPWALIALAMALWVVGDVVYGVIGTEPAVSVADVFYLAGYVTLFVGVVQLVAAGTRERRGDGFIDLAITSVAAFYAAWVLVVAPTWSTSDVSGAGRSVVASYPALDAALLILLAQLLFTRRRTAAVVLFALGMATVFGGDIAYAILLHANADLSSTLLNASWPLGYALVALATSHPSVRVQRSEMRPRSILHPMGLYAAALALASIPAVAVVADLMNKRVEPTPLMVAASTVVGLVFWRVKRLQQNAERANAALEQSERYFHGLAMNSSDAYVVIAGDGTITDTSPDLEKVIGWSRDDTIGRTVATQIETLAHPDDAVLASHFFELARNLTGRAPAVLELRVRQPDGTFAWFEAHATNLLDDSAVRGVVLNFHDIDERKRAEADLLHEAFHDPLTNLANRSLLRDRIEQALARSGRSGGTVAVLFCDLDGFKTVNDTMGHEAGDELLKVVATRLQSAARDEDTIARLGSDEFAAVVEGGDELLRVAETVAERILQVLSDPVEIAQTPMVMTASIGIALATDITLAARAAVDELLRRADVAMYNAKVDGGNRYAIFDAAMSSSAVNQFSLTSELLEALERHEFVVEYQPVVELDTQRLTGFEALVRWQHPTRGRLGPGEFIPTAEKTGKIVEIGRWILQEACAAAAEWPARNEGAPLTVAVNAAAAQVETDALVRDVEEALESSGLDPRRLVVEVTESTLISHPDAALRRLNALRDLGVRIAIDDFGTGYSSLSYLQRFPVDILKIDRSFIETIASPTQLPAVVRGLIELGRILELEMIAEGIETPDQRAALALEGGVLGQGFLFSKPIGREQAAAFAESRVHEQLDGSRR